jgi:hypothetical protein
MAAVAEVKVVITRFGGPNVHETLPKALLAVCEAVLTEANKTIPLETGTMQRSGRVEVSGNEGQVSYDTPYAVQQHEDPHFRHDPGRRDHWLERTVEEMRDELSKIVQMAMKRGATGR